MKIAKRITVLFVLLFVLLSSVWSSAIWEALTGGSSNKAAGGYTEGRLYFLSRSILNNKNMAIDLSQTETYPNGSSNIPTSTFSASEPDYALFRLVDTLFNSVTANSQTRAIAQINNSVTMTITSDNGWCFISEDDPSSKRPFGIKAFVHTSELNYTTGEYGSYQTSSHTVTTNGSVASGGSGSYTLTIPYTNVIYPKFNNNKEQNSPYAKYVREIDICLSLDNPGNTADYEPGYYYTVLHYSTDHYYEHDIQKDNDDDVWKPVQDEEKYLSGDITIWGYIGVDPETGEGGYNFSVIETNNTYSLDLTQNTAYDIAHMNFTHVKIQTGGSSPSTQESTDSTRFTIYISPESDYETDYSNGSGFTGYYFSKLNTEGAERVAENTVYYDLYSDSSGTTQFPNYVTDNNVTVNSTYVVRPEYDWIQTQHSTSGNSSSQNSVNKYTKTWSMKDIPLYLKITEGNSAYSSYDKTHLAGLYTTTIYFTLVVNEDGL